MPASPPTARALDVLELLGRPGSAVLRFSDVTRELGLTQATAHAILSTLVDRGWLVRDTLDKTYALGPGLAVVAQRADAGRPLVVAARAAARELRVSTGHPASVIERIGESVIVTAYETGSGKASLPVGDQFPFAAPFGSAFAAWEPAAVQRAWRERCGVTDPELVARLETHLAAVRERGYEFDWMTPALSQVASLVGSLRADGVSPAIQAVVSDLLSEILAEQFAGNDATGRTAHLVTTISAPVRHPDGRIALLLSVHPAKQMTDRQVEKQAQGLIAAAFELEASTNQRKAAR